MEKSSDQMDLDGWELLSDDEFLLDHEGDVSKGTMVSTEIGFDSSRKCVFDMNYFICQSPMPHRIGETTENSSDSKGANQAIQVPIQLESIEGNINKEEEEIKETVKEVIKVPIIEIKSQNLKAVGGDQEMAASQVFFKKLKGNEFTDYMKIDSTKSIKPQIDAGSIQFDQEKEEADHKSHDQGMPKKKNYMDSSRSTEVVNWEGKNGGINIWRWRLNGIGALCSMGIAAASICIFILGSHQRHKHHSNQKLRFQICAHDEKRIKQLVHHATKMNQAVSAVRGVPATRAHVTFGGYYEGL